MAEGVQLTRQDATHVQVTAAAAVGAAVVVIQGRWRWVEATVTRAHPGGAAGSYDIFVVAADNKIDSTPAPGTDDTNYAFDLRVLKAGETPTIVKGTLDIFRKIGSCEWSGTEITRVDQTVPVTPTHAHRHATGQPDAIAPSDIGASPESEIEALRSALVAPLQPGARTATDMAIGGSTINAATGAITLVGTGGTIWINSGSGLVRTASSIGGFSAVAPPSLPANGKFMCIGIQLAAAAFGAQAVASAVSGAEQTTEAAALAAPAALSSERTRIWDFVVKNTAGVYSIVAARDRRPWAAGAFGAIQMNGVGAVETKGVAGSLLWPKPSVVRLEISAGSVVRIRGPAKVQIVSATTENDVVRLKVLVDGAKVWEQLVQSGFNPVKIDMQGGADIVVALAAGSHTFDMTALWEAGPAQPSVVPANENFFTVEEIPNGLRGNGTV